MEKQSSKIKMQKENHPPFCGETTILFLTF